jgi:hypothetical protein
MERPCRFGARNLLLRPFGIVCWCIVEMEAKASKPLPEPAVTAIFLDVMNNRCEKELCIISHDGRQSQKPLDAAGRLINGNQTNVGLNFLCHSTRNTRLDEAKTESWGHSRQNHDS